MPPILALDVFGNVMETDGFGQGEGPGKSPRPVMDGQLAVGESSAREVRRRLELRKDVARKVQMRKLIARKHQQEVVDARKTALHKHRMRGLLNAQRVEQARQQKTRQYLAARSYGRSMGYLDTSQLMGDPLAGFQDEGRVVSRFGSFSNEALYGLESVDPFGSAMGLHYEMGLGWNPIKAVKGAAKKVGSVAKGAVRGVGKAGSFVGRGVAAGARGVGKGAKFVGRGVVSGAKFAGKHAVAGAKAVGRGVSRAAVATREGIVAGAKFGVRTAKAVVKTAVVGLTLGAVLANKDFRDSYIDDVKVVGGTIIRYNPLVLASKALKATPGINLIYEGVDKLSGGSLTSMEKLYELPGRALQGEKITRAELVENLVFAVKLGAIAISGGSAAALIGAASGALKAGPLGRVPGIGTILSVGEVAGLALTGGGSLTTALISKGQDLAVAEAQNQVLQRTPLGQSAIGQFAVGALAAGAGRGDTTENIKGFTQNVLITKSVDVAARKTGISPEILEVAGRTGVGVYQARAAAGKEFTPEPGTPPKVAAQQRAVAQQQAFSSSLATGAGTVGKTAAVVVVKEKGGDLASTALQTGFAYQSGGMNQAQSFAISAGKQEVTRQSPVMGMAFEAGQGLYSSPGVAVLPKVTDLKLSPAASQEYADKVLKEEAEKVAAANREAVAKADATKKEQDVLVVLAKNAKQERADAQKVANQSATNKALVAQEAAKAEVAERRMVEQAAKVARLQEETVKAADIANLRTKEAAVRHLLATEGKQLEYTKVTGADVPVKTASGEVKLVAVPVMQEQVDRVQTPDGQILEVKTTKVQSLDEAQANIHPMLARGYLKAVKPPEKPSGLATPKPSTSFVQHPMAAMVSRT